VPLTDLAPGPGGVRHSLIAQRLGGRKKSLPSAGRGDQDKTVGQLILAYLKLAPTCRPSLLRDWCGCTNLHGRMRSPIRQRPAVENPLSAKPGRVQLRKFDISIALGYVFGSRLRPLAPISPGPVMVIRIVRSLIAISSSVLCALSAGCVSGPQSAAAAELQVWTTTQTVSVPRHAPPQRGVSVSMGCARNEWESFQILVRASRSIDGIRLTAGELKKTRSGATIPAENIRLYRQHQIHITQSSNGRGRGLAFQPGWYPDALIPFSHPLTGRPLPSAKYSAIPFDLPANETHGFLADIYVPSTAQAGQYHGTLELTADGESPVKIPVSLTVWDFELPKFATLKTDFGVTMNQFYSYYPKVSGRSSKLINWTSCAEQIRELVSRHRINPQVPKKLVEPAGGQSGKPRFTVAQIAGLQEFVDRYNVNAVRLGSPIPHDKAAVLSRAAPQEAVVQGLARAADEAYAKLDHPQVLFYTYLIDEPGSAETYDFIRTYGSIARRAASNVKVLVVEQPAPENPRWGNLYGAVDIWCPVFSRFKPADVAARQARGETFWVYTTLNWWQLDYPLINFRAPAWTAWHYDVEGLLYWNLAYWENVADPWTQPQTYFIGRAPYNGEGSMLYPAHAAGFEGAVPSLRLKAIRDSIEDYEYLAILQRQGKAEQARKITSRLLGSYSAGYGPFMKRYVDSRAHERARLALAELIK